MPESQSPGTAVIHVDAQALQELRDAVYAREGRLHGLMGREASQALRDRARHIRGHG